MEDAVMTVHSYREGLGIIFERVGRRLDAFVTDIQPAILFQKREIDEGTAAMNAAGRNVARHPQMAYIGLVAHGLQLADRDVVTLIIADTSEGKIAHRGDDDNRGNNDFCVTLLDG